MALEEGVALDPSIRVWLIGGPTASGKSVLALKMADRLDAEIISADAMQVYADLRVLTARPSTADEAAAPHHLFGVADGSERWSVGRWLRAARQTLAELAAKHRRAVVVGGTGLYLKALERGLAEVPPIPTEASDAALAQLESLGEEAFRRDLARIDPQAEGRIAPGDRQRLARAFEVWLATGRPLSEWREHTSGGLPTGQWQGLIVQPPRDEVYRRCDQRLENMIRGGALEEVARLVARRLSADRPILKALGVQPLAAYLRGEMRLEEALARARTDTRHYAKRQLTWFRNQTADWRRVGQDP